MSGPQGPAFDVDERARHAREFRRQWDATALGWLDAEPGPADGTPPDTIEFTPLSPDERAAVLDALGDRREAQHLPREAPVVWARSPQELRRLTTEFETERRRRAEAGRRRSRAREFGSLLGATGRVVVALAVPVGLVTAVLWLLFGLHAEGYSWLVAVPLSVVGVFMGLVDALLALLALAVALVAVIAAVVGVLWGVVRVITWVLDRPPLRVEVPAGFPGELRRWLPFELTRAGELSLQPVVRDPVGSTSSTPVRLCRPGRWGPGRRSRVDLDAVSLAWLVQRGEVTPAARARERRDGDRALASVPQVVLHDHLSLVLERPARARVRVLPDGQRRLHGDDAPALEWSDGEVEHVVRGVQVPADLFEGRLSIAQIHALDNSEQRRIAIERMGWQRYLEQARLTPVAEADDPANPGATLRLYEVPGTEDARLLVMRNGSPDRSGVDRFYAEPVPARFGDPVEAAAWQYGCPVETYRALERRT